MAAGIVSQVYFYTQPTLGGLVWNKSLEKYLMLS
jgi:hypothetical protein